MIDEALGRRARLYPDLLELLSGVTPEIDGDEGHASLEKRRRDANRDRILGDFLRVIRTPATDVLRDPAEFGRSTSALILQRRRESWLPAGVTMTVRGNHVVLHRPRRPSGV